MRAILLIMIISLTANVGVCQEMQWFKSICDRITRDDANFAKRKSVPFYLAVSPTTNEKMVLIDTAKIDSSNLSMLKLSREQQLEILQNQGTPFTPLPKLIYFVNYFDFFPDGLVYKSTEKIFKVISSKAVFPSDGLILRIFKVGVRHNELIFSLRSEKSSKIYNLYVPLDCNFTSARSKIINDGSRE